MTIPSTNPLVPSVVYTPTDAISTDSSTPTKAATTLKKKINEGTASPQPMRVTAVKSEGEPLLEEETLAPANSEVALEPPSEALADENKRTQNIFRRCFCCK